MSKVCPNCKNNVWSDDAKFCNMCGYFFEHQENQNQTVNSQPVFSPQMNESQMNEYNENLNDIPNTINTNNDINSSINNESDNKINSNFNKSEKPIYYRKSFIIGIVSIVISLLFNLLALIPAIVGIILSIKEGKQGRISLILNIVAIIIVVVSTVIIVTQFNGVDYRYAGKYKCSPFSSTMSEEDFNFDIGLYLGIDKTFEMKDSDKLYVKGKYEVESSHADDHLNTKGYEIIVSTTHREIDNKLLTEPYKTKYGLSFDVKTKRLIMMNTITNSMFVCKKDF